MWNYLRTTTLICLLFLAIWLPRTLALDAFATADEHDWLTFSANFYQALGQGNWAQTFQIEHPGVLVMAAGALAFAQQIHPSATFPANGFSRLEDELEQWLAANSTVQPLPLLATGRWWLTLWGALALTFAFFPLRRLWGAGPAIGALLLVGWDPFLLGLSRQLHPDAFLPSLTLLALALFAGWLYGEGASQRADAPSKGRPRRYLVASGIVTGLAWLTKVPMVVLGPTCLLLVALELWRQRRDKSGAHLSLRQAVIAFAVWGALAVIATVALWPALWGDALGVLLRMVNEMRSYAGGHVNPNFFAGAVVDDPGPLFYPAVLLWRATPATLIGCVALLWPSLWRSRLLQGRAVRQSVVALLLFVFLFLGLMTAGAKKFERYMAPTLAILDLVAALGWVGLWQVGCSYFCRCGLQPHVSTERAVANRTYSDWIIRVPFIRRLLGAILLCLKWFRRRNNGFAFKIDNFVSYTKRALRAILTPLALKEKTSTLPADLTGLMVAAVLFHGALTVWCYPYYLTYYNPVVGGVRTASRLFMIGWGEGLDEAARWLNQQPDAADLRAVAWYPYGSFSYFFAGATGKWTYLAPLAWLDTDYVVIYANQWQRNLPSADVLNHFMVHEPVHVIWSNGLELVRIYDMRDTLLPDFVALDHAQAADFDGQIRLAAYEIEERSGKVAVTLYLQSLAPITQNYNRLLRLLDRRGQEVWRAEGWPWDAPTKDWPIRTIRPDSHTIALPAALTPGLYKLTLGFYDPATFDPLPVTPPNQPTPDAPTEHAVSLLQVGALPQSLAPTDWRFGDAINLTGVALPTEGQPGATLPVTLRWQNRALVPVNYTVFLHLVSEDGILVAQQDQQPLGGFAPTSLWQPDLPVIDDYQIGLPADLPAGVFTLRVGLYTMEHGRLPVQKQGAPVSDFAEIGAFRIVIAK